MAAESYEYYLRLLKLPRNAPEKDIRTAITNELRIWTRRVNSPKLELRQEAERMIATLEAAEKVILGAEGQIIRQRQESQPTTASEVQPELSVDAQTVARAIERLAYARGRKAQERKGTVQYKRATIFYNGIEYLIEELVHKKYEAAQDRKRCCATQGGLIPFVDSNATICRESNRNGRMGEWANASQLRSFADKEESHLEVQMV